MVDEQTILDIFQAKSQNDPDHPLYTWVDNQGRDQATLTYAQFYKAAIQTATYLTASCNIEVGDRVLLVYPPGLDFVKAFVGCLYAGIVPVPVAPPNLLKAPQEMKALEATLTSSGSVAILTNGPFRRSTQIAALKTFVLRRHKSGFSDVRHYRTDKLPHYADSIARPTVAPRPAELAFVQYTSGSTTAPKGVMISHANILHQLKINAQELKLDEQARSVLWVPHFHDFCLISGLLSALYGNGRLYLLSPLAFLQNPGIWFDTLTRTQATHTAAPDFAYRMAVDKTTATQRQHWDLSSLRVAMNAAEPIRPSTVDRFAAAFAASKLNPQAICPAYGLAEHTVGVSVAGRQRIHVARDPLERAGTVQRVRTPLADGSTLTFIGCGQPSAGVDLRIVDPDTARSAARDAVGEIWVNSPSKAMGYLGLPDLSQEVFAANLQDDPTAGPYLRTGDLGFLHEGELYVMGRLKDLIIVRGRNVYPQDLEETAYSCHPQIRPGRTVAFSISAVLSEANLTESNLTEQREAATEAGEEKVILLVEVRHKKHALEQYNEIVRAIRTRLLEEYQISCHAILVAPPGTVEKTTSGKIRRQAVRQAYLAGTLQAAALHMDSLAVDSPAGKQRVRAPEPALVDHPLLEGITTEYRQLIADLTRFASEPGKQSGRRATHTTAISAGGHFEVLGQLDIPPHPFFVAGKIFPVIVRHSAVQGSHDDAIQDVRSATMRLVDGPVEAPLHTLDLHKSALDVVMGTGNVTFLPHAQAFYRWFTGNAQERMAMVAEFPQILPCIYEVLRNPTSYTQLFYYNKMTHWFIGQDGRRRFMRYRLRNVDSTADGGFIDPSRYTPPLDIIPRSPNDPRSPTYLRDDFRQRIVDQGVQYLLQIQLCEVSTSEAFNEGLRNPTVAWDAERYPFQSVGLLTLTEVLPNELVEPLSFNVAHAPPSLSIIAAKSSTEGASVCHVRAIVYEMAAHLRKFGQPKMTIAASITADPPQALPLRQAVEASGAAVYAMMASRANDLTPEKLVSMMTATALSDHPQALRLTVRRFLGATVALEQTLHEQRSPGRGLQSSVEQFNAAADVATPEKIEQMTEAHYPMTMRVAEVNGDVQAKIFASYQEIRRFWQLMSLNGFADLVHSAPQTYPIGDDRAVTINRYADIRQADETVVLFEFVGAWQRYPDETDRWGVVSVLQTLQRSVAVDQANKAQELVQEFFCQTDSPEAVRSKLMLSLLTHSLVHAYRHQLLQEANRKLSSTASHQRPRKVCVIGAGISGLTTAYELERLGHQVTVFERQPMVGGKCESIEIDGKWYDLGGHICTREYAATRRLAQEVGAEMSYATPAFTYDIGRGVSLPLDQSLYKGDTLQRYLTAQQQRFPAIADAGLSHVAEALHLPTTLWLQTNELAAIEQALGVAYTAAGYGYLRKETVPVAYFLKYATLTGLLTHAADPTAYTVQTMAGGFMNFCRRIAAQLHDVRCGSQISQVVRTDHGVQVTVNGEGLPFDDLVLALPFEKSLAFLDATLGEKERFAKIRTLDYYTTLCTIEGLPRDAFYFIKQHNLDPATVGHIVAFHHRYTDSDVYVLYSYGNDAIMGDDIINHIAEDVTRMGGMLRQVHTQRKWEFMPHVSSQELAEGYLRKFEEMQGQKQTYYVGSLLSFELVECAIAYAQNLVDTHFASADANVRSRLSANDRLPTGSSPTFNQRQTSFSGPTSGHTRSPMANDNFIAPRNPVEIEIADAWCRTIGLHEVGIYENFFEIGGDSLMAAQLLAELRNIFAVDLPLPLLFENPTVAGVASAVENLQIHEKKAGVLAGKHGG